jgi:hypothetical protein
MHKPGVRYKPWGGGEQQTYWFTCMCTVGDNLRVTQENDELCLQPDPQKTGPRALTRANKLQAFGVSWTTWSPSP